MKETINGHLFNSGKLMGLTQINKSLYNISRKQGWIMMAPTIASVWFRDENVR